MLAMGWSWHVESACEWLSDLFTNVASQQVGHAQGRLGANVCLRCRDLGPGPKASLLIYPQLHCGAPQHRLLHSGRPQAWAGANPNKATTSRLT